MLDLADNIIRIFSMSPVAYDRHPEKPQQRK